MITPSEAEALAHKIVEEYVNQCGCNSHEDVGNVLMKLISMSGLAMCAVVGQADAVGRMVVTTDYIAHAQAGKNWKQQTVN